MEKITPREKYAIMNDLSLAVTCANRKPVYYDTESDKQVKQTEANKFIERYLNIKKYRYYKVDERIKLKHLHLTKDAIILIGGTYLYVNAEKYYYFDDIDVNEKVVSIWFLSTDDAEKFN